MIRSPLPHVLLAAVVVLGVAFPAGAAEEPWHDAQTSRADRLTRGDRAAGAQPPSVQAPHPPQPPRPQPQPRPRPGAPGRSADARQEDRTVRELTLGPSGELSLSNIAGDIEIRATKGGSARLEIVKTAFASNDAEARALLDTVQVHVTERKSRVEVSTAHPTQDRSNRRGGGVVVSYRVDVPADTRIRAHSISGSISASGVTGESSYESVSGTIRVAGGGRIVAAKSISGDVEVSDTEMDTTFQASSASGSIALRRVAARRLDIGSISGSVVLEAVRANRVSAQTVSGEVRFDGPLDRDGRYQLRSHSGSIRIAVAANAGFEVDATTFSGPIKTDFPISAPPAPGSTGRTLRGVHGDGSAVIELSTFSGSISIVRR